MKVYHLTDTARFKLDPKKVPVDNTIAIYSREAPGLFVAPWERLNSWILGNGYFRPFIVELEVDKNLLKSERWNGELFLPTENFDAAKITRVIAIDAQAREEFGAYGWTEEYFETDFETGEPLPEGAFPSISEKPDFSKMYPFHGYRAKDVRKLGAAWCKKYAKRVRDYARKTGKIESVASFGNLVDQVVEGVPIDLLVEAVTRNSSTTTTT